MTNGSTIHRREQPDEPGRNPVTTATEVAADQPLIGAGLMLLSACVTTVAVVFALSRILAYLG